MASAIEIFHWLFTCKILYGNMLSARGADTDDLIRLVLSVFAVACLMWHSLTRRATEELGIRNAMLLNAVLLTEVTLIRLVMTLPFSINHCFLEFYISSLLLVLNTNCGRGVHNYAIISKLYLSVWCISAIQKLVHGRFLNGESFIVAWQTRRYSELGRSLEFMRGIVPQLEVGRLFAALAVIVFSIELLVPLCIIFFPKKRYLWYGMFLMQFGVWQATGEQSFAMTGFILCFLGLKGPCAPLRACSRLPKRILIVLVIWPFLHMDLASIYGFSPWRLGGWGMYSTPHFLSEFEVAFTIEESSEYSFKDIPWPEEQRRSLANDQKLYIEFNSKAAHDRLLAAFRISIADEYGPQAQVVRRKRTKRSDHRLGSRD